MNLYRPKFKDRKTGELRETERWYIDFRDHNGTRQRFAGDTDKHATAEFGKMLNELVKCRKRHVQPADKLWGWLMGLPVDVQGKLVGLGLAEQQWFAALAQSERLADWIAEFENWLRTSKAKSGYSRSARHVGDTMYKIRAIVDGCGFKTWADIRKSTVETYLGGLLVGLRTFNGYVGAFKHFAT